jgi:hypothetical protein
MSRKMPVPDLIRNGNRFSEKDMRQSTNLGRGRSGHAGLRRDFTAISERVKRRQPFLDEAHRRFVSTEMDFDRIYIPF